MSAWSTKRTGFALPRGLKGLAGLFILWWSLGVGELFDKIDLKMQSL